MRKSVWFLKKKQKLRGALLVCLFLLMVFSFFTPLTVSAKVFLSQDERKFVEKINDYREEKGLSKLKVSKELTKAAELMAKDMKKHPEVINHQHTDSEGRTTTQRAVSVGYRAGVGENIAAGYKTASKVFSAWKGSEEHLNNIKYPEYEVMGISLVKGDNSYKYYWVNTFGVKEKKEDVLKDYQQAKLVKIKVTVTDAKGDPLKKAKVSVFTGKRKKLESGKTDKKGRVTLYIEPRTTKIYVRASKAGFAYYNKKVSIKKKKSKSVKMWLEKEK